MGDLVHFPGCEPQCPQCGCDEVERSTATESYKWGPIHWQVIVEHDTPVLTCKNEACMLTWTDWEAEDVRMQALVDALATHISGMWDALTDYALLRSCLEAIELNSPAVEEVLKLIKDREEKRSEVQSDKDNGS